MEISFTSLAIVAATGFVAPLAIGFVFSVALGFVVGLALDAGGIVKSPLLIAIMFSATGLGIVIAVLKDADKVETSFGQLVIAGSSIAEVGTIVLLTLFFSGESSSVGAKVVLLGLFVVLCVAVIVAVMRLEHSMRVMETLVRLQDTTAQIRVRGAFVLLAVFVVLASEFGLEAILGAFLAGAIIKLVDRDMAMTHPQFRRKLEAAGFGVFIPFFFVASGIRFDGRGEGVLTTQRELMLAGELYDAFDAELVELRARARGLLRRFNVNPDPALLIDLFERVGDGVW